MEENAEVYTGITETEEKKKPEKSLVVALWTVGLLTLLALALIGWLLTTDGGIKHAENVEEIVLTPTETAEQVLYLEVYDHLDNSVATGSGFLVDDGMKLATNYHVIEGGHHIDVYDADNNFVTEITQVWNYSKDKDIALLQLNETVDILPLPLADSSLVQQGDKIFTIGYPLGLNNTLSDGIISSVFVEDGIDTLQITAPVSSGSSGGALLNENCGVIGVVVASYVDGQNMNLAIASNELAEVLMQDKEVTPLEDLYLKDHPQLAFEDYKAEIQCLWVPDEYYADIVWEEWYYLDGDLSEVLELLESYDGIEEAYLYEKTDVIVPGEWSEAFDEWCFDPCRRLGDIEIFSEDDGYTICCYVDAVEEETVREEPVKEPEQPKEETPAEEPEAEVCDHQYNWSVTKEATCTGNGTKTGKCKLCSHTVTENIPALGHQEVVDVAEKAATCTEQGNGKTSHCNRCGKKLSVGEIYAIIEHDYKEGKCTMCGYATETPVLTSLDIQGTWTRERIVDGKLIIEEYRFGGTYYDYWYTKKTNDKNYYSNNEYMSHGQGKFYVEGNVIYCCPSDSNTWYESYIWNFTGDTITIDSGTYNKKVY